MNLSKILGVSLALVAGSVGVAHAINPATVPAANRVYFGGATATDNILENVLILQTGGVCQAGTIDIYRGGVGNNQRVIACNAAIAGLVGQPIAFFKESEGGSGNGVNPVANATNLNFLDVDNPAFTCNAPTTVAATSTLNSYTQRTGCSPTAARVPVAGVADVEPKLLGATQAQINALTTQGVLGIVFNPSVSLPLYRALQQAQGLTQNDQPENVPSLTSPQIRGLFTGFVADWTQFDDLAGIAPADSAVYVCRRGDTSGTQASFESFFLNQRCVDGVTAFVSPDDSACQTPGCAWNATTYENAVVFAGASSGNVRSCLDARAGQGRWAIAVTSTEAVYNNTNNRWRFIRVDGELPTLESVANGRYQFFTENVINRRTGALTTNQTTIVNYLVANLGQPTIISGINAPFQVNAHGDGGVISVPNFATINPNAAPATQAAMRTNPVNTQLRNGNNCTPPLTAGFEVTGGG